MLGKHHDDAHRFPENVVNISRYSRQNISACFLYIVNSAYSVKQALGFWKIQEKIFNTLMQEILHLFVINIISLLTFNETCGLTRQRQQVLLCLVYLFQFNYTQFYVELRLKLINSLLVYFRMKSCYVCNTNKIHSVFLKHI